MNAFDIAVVAAAAATGWFIVSWLFTLGKGRRTDAASPSNTEGARNATDGALSIAQLAHEWHGILGVSEEASIEVIEARFHEAIAECDRTRASGMSSREEIAAAESRRRAVIAAYEFIRSSRRAKLTRSPAP